MARKRYLSAFICIFILILTICSNAYALSNAKPASSITAYNAATPEDLSRSNLYAQTAVLMDAKTGRVLFDKDMDYAMYPASTTKIMTALLTLENCGNLQKVVSCSLKSTQSEATWIPVRYQEEYTIEQLLYALMMKSANDAAIVLAEEVAGSVEAFAEMMNQRAKELGCKNTHFVTPNGLPNSNHYTTAYDMALIACTALKNNTFRKIITTQSYELPPTNKRDYSVQIENSNKFLSNSGDSDYSYEYGIGIKTGYTSAAQNAFVGAAERDGILLVSVVLGSTKEGKWLDTTKLMDYGFSSRFDTIDLLSVYERNPHKLLITGALEQDVEDGMLTLDIQEDQRMLLTGYLEEKDNITDAVSFYKNYVTISDVGSAAAPIEEGQVLAQLTFSAPFMSEAVTVNLVSPHTIQAKPAPTNAPILTPVPSSGEASSSANIVFPSGAAGSSGSKKKLLAYLMLIPAAILMLIALIVLYASIHRAKKRRRRQQQRARDYYSQYDHYERY